MVASDAGVVRSVGSAGKPGDVQIGDGDDVEVIAFEVGQHLIKMGELLGVDGERTMLLLEIDIEVQDIGGDFVGAQTRGDFAHA